MITQEFTIYDTGLFNIEVDGKSFKIESWVVEDSFFDAPCWKLPIGAPPLRVMAKLLTPYVLKELKMEQFKKHKEAECVAVVRKSVADIASEFDLQNLIAHEAGHAALGHDGSEPWEEAERQVRELIGEVEIANDLFAQRYVAIKQARLE